MNYCKRLPLKVFIKKLYLVAILIFTTQAIAQVKIGDNPNSIDVGSVLELESTSRALVISRVSGAQMGAMITLAGAMVYNTDEQCIFYFNGALWNNLCSLDEGDSVSIIDNGDGTYTVDDGTNPPFTFNGAPETLSSLVDNANGTYTYTDEIGGQITFSQGSSIVDNSDGTYTVDDGTNPPFTFNGAPETLSSLVENADGTYTYTDEIGGLTTFPKGVSLVDNGDGTYTVDDGTNPPFTFNGEPETLSTLVDNTNGTYTYTDEDGDETIIVSGGGGNHLGTAGSIFFADATVGIPTEDNGQFFWDNVNKRLGIGTTTPRNAIEVANRTIRSGRFEAGRGNYGHAAYNFSNDIGTGMISPQNGNIVFTASGREILRVNREYRVGINENTPLATLHVGGDLIVDGTITSGSGAVINKSSLSSSSNIRRVSAGKVAITVSDNTVILEGTVAQLNLPNADSNLGHIFVIKDLGGSITALNLAYRNSENKLVSQIDQAKVIWLQSDGKEWQQIN